MKKAPGQAKEMVLEAAGKLFALNGFKSTTVREIAAEIGILSGSLFHHFPSKEAILFELMQSALTTALQQMKQARDASSSEQHLLLSLIENELRNIHVSSGRRFRLILMEWRSLTDEHQQEILVLREQYEGIWLLAITRYGSVQPLRSRPFFLRALIRGAMIETGSWYDPDGELGIEALSQEVFNTFFSINMTSPLR